MDVKKATKVIDEICSSAEYERMFGFDKMPSPGEFVIACSWRLQPILKRIGYVCQIRLNRGQFGSDMYFLRLCNGGLITFENESFIKMTAKQKSKALGIFKTWPEEEQIGEQEYRDSEGVRETGFIIENSKSQPTPDTSFAITITGGKNA